jgi:hypothetical protein
MTGTQKTGLVLGGLFVLALANANRIGARLGLGHLSGELHPYSPIALPWNMDKPMHTTQAPRERKLKCVRYRFVRDKHGKPRKQCAQYRKVWVTPEGHRVGRPVRWKADCPECFPRRQMDADERQEQRRSQLRFLQRLVRKGR